MQLFETCFFFDFNGVPLSASSVSSLCWIGVYSQVCEGHSVVTPFKDPASIDSPNFYSVIFLSEFKGRSDSEVNLIFLLDNNNYNRPKFELSKCKVTWLNRWNSWHQILLSSGSSASLMELAEYFLSKEKLGNKNGNTLLELSVLSQNFSCINPTNWMELHPFLSWLGTPLTESNSRSLD